jgi:hypothetical protein
MITVEAITRPEDFTIDLVYEIFKEVGDRFPAEHGTINIAHMVDEWKSHLAAGVGSTWLARRDGRPIGVLGALFIIDFYTAKLMAFEHFWFVLEAERKGGPGLRLFREFEKEWNRRGCNTVWMGQNHINSPVGLNKFYERKGFINWGTTFRKVINHG